MAGRERSFAHLTTQTGFTPGALGTEREYAQAAHIFDMPALGIADCDTIDSWVPFEYACENNGVQPVFGVTLFPAVDNYHQYPVSLLVQDARGFHDLYRILDKQQAVKDRILTVPEIIEHSDGLVVVASPPVHDVLSLYTFDPHRLFYSLSHFGDRPSDQQLAEDIKRAEQLQAQTVVNNQVWKAQPKRFDQILSHVIYSRRSKRVLRYEDFVDTDIAHNRAVYDLLKSRHVPANHPEGWLKPPMMMHSLVKEGTYGYEHWQKACDTTVHIANNVTVDTLPQVSMPRYPVPEGQTSYNVLLKRVGAAIFERYPDFSSLPDQEQQAIMNRVTREMRVIGNRGLSDFFLMVDDVVQHAKKFEPSIRKAGIGSQVGSQVCYILGITDIPPIPNNLLFERFLGPEGSRIPDSDLHVDAARRSVLFDYLFTTFPEKGMYVARIATFPTYNIDGAVRLLLETFGFEKEEIDRIKGTIFPDRRVKNPDLVIKQNARQYQEKLGVNPELIDAAIELKSRSVSTGYVSTHSSKVIFSSRPFVETHPVSKVGGYPRVSESKDTIERKNIVNLDLVSSNRLTLLENLVTTLTIDEDRIPRNDEEVLREIFLGHTTGIPDIETVWLKTVLWNYGKSARWEGLTEHDLVLTFLLSRPGVGDNYRERFYEQRAKNEPYSYRYDAVDKILQESYGIVVSQEQIIRLVSEVGGFTPMEAERVRKHISHELSPRKLRESIQAFYHRAVENGVSEEQARFLASQIMHFSKYGFIKGHGMVLVDTAYKLAWIKQEYPEEFLQQVIDLEKGHYFQTGHPEAYDEELRRLLR